MANKSEVEEKWEEEEEEEEEKEEGEGEFWGPPEVSDMSVVEKVTAGGGKVTAS